MPADTPSTLPEPSTVAFELLLAHVPPALAVASLSEVIDPIHTEPVPVIGAGVGSTVTIV